MTTNRSRLYLSTALVALILLGLGLGALALSESKPTTTTTTHATGTVATTSTSASKTTSVETIVPPFTSTPAVTTGEALTALRPSKPGDIAFCGPGYGASPSEWQAVAAAGIYMAYPPCSTYPFGQPIPWPVWDGSVRYMGFEPWTSVPHNTFESYLANAAAAGVRVFGFAPELWATNDPAAVLATLPSGPNHPISWVLPEEPSTVEQVTAFVPLAAALKNAGLIVHINFTSTLTPEIAKAATALIPDLVSSDDYSSLSAALVLDHMVSTYFPVTPRLAAVSTVQYDCGTPVLTPDERSQWVGALANEGAAILWFTWDLPQLDQSCQGQDAGTPWIGGLYDADSGTFK